MLSKLAFRNMKRSARDYLVYVLTMTLVTALVYAFSSLIFQKNFIKNVGWNDMMGMMVIVASVFVVLIAAWLIGYMVRFILEKRSGEFAIYLLLGMKKKRIAKLYMRETLLLGSGAFLLGLVLGILLQQVLQAVLLGMLREEYHLRVSLHPYTFLMTLLCYYGCYLLALLRCGKKFRKMNIHDLMEEKRKNEEIHESHEGIKRILLPVSVGMILLFWAVFGMLRDAGQIVAFLIGLVITIYLFYIGVSAWITCYIRKRGSAIYRGQNLFLLRQFASKMRSMQFTMGTLTALFTLALMGASVALMFMDYQNTLLDKKFPFDVQVYNNDVEEVFQGEKRILEEYAPLKECYTYHIYMDRSSQANTWMYTNLDAFGTMYRKKDGSPDMEKIEEMLKEDITYCQYDTYMGESDYNKLRAMLGYPKVRLGQDSYLIHVKERLRKQVEDMPEDMRIMDAAEKHTLSCAGIYSEAFSQDGQNGGDYVIVVPDEVLGRMEPYYSELAAKLDGAAPKDLQGRLEQLHTEEEKDFGGHGMEMAMSNNGCIGSDTILNYAVDILVRDQLIPEAKLLLASIIFPLFYIGMVFLCVAVTVLSVQQLSDSAKHRQRYDVLKKLGLRKGKIGRIILKQLSMYYLCPVLLAIVISGKMIFYLSRLFVRETGVPSAPAIYFGKSILLFLGIYLVYFIVTYIGFRRNVEEIER